jgi:glycerophosphoryl diester phosphodiesterase
MLIIGHRGAGGIAHQNSLEAMQAGIDAGADILEFDVRLTKDNIPVVSHDFHTLRSHRRLSIISRHTLSELREMFQDQPIITLKEMLDTFFGKILLNIEIKGRGIAKAVIEFIKDTYIHTSKDWDLFFISSFWGNELSQARKASKDVNLALLQSENPYLFIAYYKRIRLSAVGFHRLYAPQLAIEIARKLKLFTYVYTVDRPGAALIFSQHNIDGIVTNRPDIILKSITKVKK